jgi:hypothetical protein
VISPGNFFSAPAAGGHAPGRVLFFQTHESFQTTHGRKTKQAQEEIPALVF